MQQDSVRPLPQSSSQGAIKDNLQKYSPFYKQAMHFNGEGVETLFYVAHSNFSSEKAVEKIQAFGLFKDKKIVFVEYQGDERGHVIDAGVEEGDDEGVHEQPRGNSAHFTVKVKNKGSYTFRELEISADGKCGIASSIVALNEILRGEAQLSSEVLLRGDKFVSGDPQDGDIVESDPENPFDVLLKKTYRLKTVKTADGDERYGELKLHHCVRDNLTSESPEFQRIFGNLPDQSREKVEKLLTKTQKSDWLEPQHVYEILTTNLGVMGKIRARELQNISADNIFLFQATIPATLVAGGSLPHAIAAEEPITRPPEVSSDPNADNQTLTRAGLPNEGMELEPDKTLKHEFRIIVLNILHEWINEADQDFSEINKDNFLESLIKEKLGDNSVKQIKKELGGEITFKSLLAIDEDLSPQVASPTTLAPIPEKPSTNQTEQLEKEREAFYSAPCGDGKKVFEKILNLMSALSKDSIDLDLLTLLQKVGVKIVDLQKNDETQALINSMNIDQLIETAEKLKERELQITPALSAPAQPDYSRFNQLNAGYESKITKQDLERAFSAGYSSNIQPPKMYTFYPALNEIELSETRVVGVQTNVIAADHPAATGCDVACTRAQAENARCRILAAGNPPAPGFACTRARILDAGNPPAPASTQTNLSVKKSVTWEDQPEPSDSANAVESNPIVNWKKSKLRTSDLPRNGDKYLSRRKTTENSSQDDFLGQLGGFGDWIYKGGQKNLSFLTTTILDFSSTFNIQSFFSDGKEGDVGDDEKDKDAPKNNPSKPGIGDIFSVLTSCLGDRNKSH